MNKKIIIIMSIVVALLIMAVFTYYILNRTLHNPGTDDEYYTISKLGCEWRSGRIVGLPHENCTENEINLGFIENLKCPCICCISK